MLDVATSDLFQRALARDSEGLLDQAVADYEAVLRKAPEYAPAWLNLSAAYRRQRRWDDSLRCALRAGKAEPTNLAAWRNAGIASTALSQWDEARIAWSACGIELPEGEGVLEMELGPIGIRLGSEPGAEIVWCTSIDPCRAVIGNVPSPESGRSWGDVLLHDAELVEERVFGPHTLPVYTELAVLEPSGISTVRAWVIASSPGDAQDLSDFFDAHDACAEDWTPDGMDAGPMSVVESTTSALLDWLPDREFGIAASLEEAEDLLEEWSRASSGRLVFAVEVTEKPEPPRLG
ncbi:MAG: tetratricopeptide repeat protein [Chloroflexota bacterium]